MVAFFDGNLLSLIAKFNQNVIVFLSINVYQFLQNCKITSRKYNWYTINEIGKALRKLRELQVL